MRLNDLSGGSIKTLLILVLILANIAVALAHHRALPQLLPNGGAAPALSRVSLDTLAADHELPGGAPTRADEAPALPGRPPR
jgi:hypothetical protein